MKLIRNKFAIGLLCIALGVGIALALTLNPSPAGSAGAATTVLRLKQTVEAGTELTAEMVEAVKLDRNIVPDGAVNSLDALPSRYAASRLYAGDVLTANKASGTVQSADLMAACTAKGMKAVSVTVSTLASGVSGKLRPGDVVSVLFVPRITATTSASLGSEPQATATASPQSSMPPLPQTVSYPELKYLEVCSTSAADGSDARVSAALTDKEKNALPVTVTLFVTEEQAARLVELEQKGGIHLVFVARREDAAMFIPNARRVLGSAEVKK